MISLGSLHDDSTQLNYWFPLGKSTSKWIDLSKEEYSWAKAMKELNVVISPGMNIFISL